MTLIAVLDYGIGNLRSAQKALQRVGADARLTADPGLVADAKGVVLPGVGAFGRCMEALRHAELDHVARSAIDAGTPFLGICVGMQMLFAGSDETPGVEGLGVFPQRVRLLPDTVKRPQMQWNVLRYSQPSPLFDSLPDPAWVYFVHSFAAEPSPDLIASCDYGGAVTAAVARGSVFATQFHPEKSGTNGLQILRNFVSLAEGSTA